MWRPSDFHYTANAKIFGPSVTHPQKMRRAWIAENETNLCGLYIVLECRFSSVNLERLQR